MSHPTLVYQGWDFEDGINSDDRADRAQAKLRRLGFPTLADHAAELRATWTKFTGDKWKLRVQLSAQALVRLDPQSPWRLFLFACGWMQWPEEAFPHEWSGA